MAGHKGQVTQADILNNARNVCLRTTKFVSVTHMGEGCILGCHRRPCRQRAGPSAHLFWGFPSIYAYNLWRRITKFDMLTHMRKGVVSNATTSMGRGPSSQILATLSTPPPHRGGGPVLPNFAGFFLFVHTRFVPCRTRAVPNFTW